MKFKLLAIAAPVIALAISAGQAGADESASDLQAGKWRSTTQFNEVSIPGLPPQVAQMMRKQMSRKQTVEYCLKPEDIRRPGAQSLGGDRAKDCRYDEWSYTGGKMRATIICTVRGQGSMRTSMVGAGSPTNYNANIDSTITNPQLGNIKMKGTVSGERIGAC